MTLEMCGFHVQRSCQDRLFVTDMQHKGLRRVDGHLSIALRLLLPSIFLQHSAVETKVAYFDELRRTTI